MYIISPLSLRDFLPAPPRVRAPHFGGHCLRLLLLLSTDHVLIPGGVNVLGSVRGVSKHAGGRKTSYWPAIRRRSDLLQTSGSLSIVTALFTSFFEGRMFSRWIVTNIIRSQNLALQQDSHSLRGSTRDLWTVHQHTKQEGELTMHILFG
jgi:hypothetical protein